MEVTRRDMLKASAVLAAGFAATGGITALGCSSEKEPEPTPVVETESDIKYEVYDTDVLVIGGGLAGLQAAYEAYAQGKNVILLEKAQYGFGGGAGFNWDQFINFQQDVPWEQGQGSFAWDALINKKMVKEAYEGLTLEERNLLLRYSRMGGGMYHRNPETGEIMPLADTPMLYGIYRAFPHVLADHVEATGLSVLDHTMATDLLVQDGVCVGVMGVHVPTGTFRVVRAKATICCTGATCWMYGWITAGPMSINSPDNTGDIDAAAFRRGCDLMDSEFFQCDLISIEPKGIAASFVSGIGADSGCCEYICDKDGNYFFKGMDYTTLNKITFTQTIAKCISEGHGTENGGVYVDFSTPEAFSKIGETYIRNIELWREVFGIDVEGTKLECALEAYEHGGNPVADEKFMIVGMPGLFHARGGGYTGSRGGSSVKYAPHYAIYATRMAIEYMEGLEMPALDEAVVAAEYNRLHELFDRTGGKRPQEVRLAIQKAAYEALQPGRSAEKMQAAIDELVRIRKEDMPTMTLGDTSMVYNTDWKCAIENYNLLDISEASAKAALFREETRGHMYRSDFPEQDDVNWLCNVRQSYNGGDIQCEKSAIVEIDS